MPFNKIEPEAINVFPLASRKSKSYIERIAISPETAVPDAGKIKPTIDDTVERIKLARQKGASVILAFGAHLVKNGLAPIVIKLMQDGWVTHLATNGASTIHDWEFSWLGRSEEDVRENVTDGKFGTWEETGTYINLAVQVGALHGMGYGEAVGAMIENESLTIPEAAQLLKKIQASPLTRDSILPARAELLQTILKFDLQPGDRHIPHPYKNYSIFAGAFKLGLPATVHPGIGYDIIYNNPFANGAALGRAAHTDYKIFVKSVSNLENGVFLSVGSAIMAPQVFEKSVSFVNNINLQNGDPILKNHFIVVNDLQESSWDWSQGEPPKESPDYYFRFLKSFYRMGGEVRYVASDNRLFLMNLLHSLNQE
jgi:hypothetical protein